MADAAPSWVQWVMQQAEPGVLELHGRSFMPSSWKMLGCGMFGCVLPARQPGVVCKVTLDGSEAFFARAHGDLAASAGAAPDGVCRYWEPIRVDSPIGPVWVLWRQLVAPQLYRDHVAPPFPKEDEPYWKIKDPVAQDRAYRKLKQDRAAWERKHGTDAREILEELTSCGLNVASRLAMTGGNLDTFLRELSRTRAQAGAGFNPQRSTMAWHYSSVTVKEFDADPMLYASVQLLAYRFHLERLFASPTMPQLASALEFYLEHGLLLADLNADNIAWLDGAWTLFDAGFTVPIAGKWKSLWKRENVRTDRWWDNNRWENRRPLEGMTPEGE